MIAVGTAAESARLAKSGGGLGAILHYDGGTQATYAAMVTRLDKQIGRVLDRLKALGMERDTIVVFTSDNGGAAKVVKDMRQVFDDKSIEPAYVTFSLDADGKVARATMKAASPLADFSYDYQDLAFTPVAAASGPPKAN